MVTMTSGHYNNDLFTNCVDDGCHCNKDHCLLLQWPVQITLIIVTMTTNNDHWSLLQWPVTMSILVVLYSVFLFDFLYWPCRKGGVVGEKKEELKEGEEEKKDKKKKR